MTTTTGGGGANGGGANGIGGSCCDTSLRCWCRWRCKEHQHGGQQSLLSSGLLFFLGCFVLYGSFAMLYAWLAFKPGCPSSSLGCLEDNEGSWSVGVFYGDSPLSLKPIERVGFVHSLVLILLFHCSQNKNQQIEK